MINSSSPPLSDFGKKCLEDGEPVVEMDGLFQDVYDPDSNTEGLINLGIAENTLMHEELREYFTAAFQLRPLDFTYGDGMTGTKRLTDAIAGYLNEEFHPSQKVERNHLVLGAGLTPIIRQIGQTIANRGDGILIVAPYYSGFDHDLTVGSEVKPIPVSMPFSDVGTLREIPHLERVIAESNASGALVKAIILCNPHNPLGRCYSREIVEAYCVFAEKHNIHLISDEIYAKSVFPSSDFPSPPPFISVLSLDLKGLGVNPARVHALYGMSKDFNSNGFRAGAFISQNNSDLMKALTVTAIFSYIASPTDALWSSLLNDREYRTTFVQENQAGLQDAYEYATEWLRFHKIPYIPSQAGHFLLIDMRSIISDIKRYGTLLKIQASDSLEKRELALWQHLLANKVMLLPGAMCHAPEAGWYRLTFAVRRDFVSVALGRIERALGWRGWSKLDGEELETFEWKFECLVQ